MAEHTILVAITVDADSRADAMRVLPNALPRPGWYYGGDSKETGRRQIDSWWIAEDDRTDRSDNDSAVFVSKGTQQQAFECLLVGMLTSTWNDPSKRETPQEDGS